MAATESDMGVRMSRIAGGGSSGKMCVFGKEGERGMGGNYSGKKASKPWNPGMKKSRMGSEKPWARSPNRYEAVSHNPSGASNAALRNDDRTMADDT